MGAASAADVSSEPAANYTGDVPLGASEETGGAETIVGSSSEGDDVLGAGTGTFTELNETINSQGTNVALDKNYVFSDGDADFKGGIPITTNNIVIDGNGYTIDGNNISRIFYVSEGVTSFTLKNVVVQNGYATAGSVIYFVDRMTNVEISGIFKDNSQRADGIIYFADGVSGNVVLNGDFTGNYAKSGAVGVVKFQTVYAGSNVVLKGNYRNNTAKSEIAVAHFTTIEEGATVVLEGTFADNYNGGDPYGAAAVAYFGSLNGNAILNGTFTNNAGKVGGIVYVYSSMNGNLTLSGTFTNNNVSGSGGVVSIAPIVNGNIILSGTFTNNSAATNGGIIYFSNAIEGNVYLSGTFTDNNATNGAVAYMNNAVNGNVYVSGDFTNNEGHGLINLKDAGTFSNIHNTAGVDGVGVRTSISATVPTSIYSDNKLKVTAKLSGIYETLWCTAYEGTVVKLTVNNNEYQAVLDDSGYGEFIIDDLNTPGTYEVKVFYEGNETYLECENSYNVTVSSTAHKSFTDLYEEINGNINETIYLDGLYAFDSVDDADLQEGINIHRNIVIDGQGTAVIDGSGLARVFSVANGVTDFTLKNVIVKNAKTTGNGAVVNLASAIDNLEIKGIFINNTAASAGVVYFNGAVNNGANVVIDGEFIDNKASYGSVAFFNSNVNGNVLLDGDYADNSATQQGGVFYFRNLNGNVELAGTFENNSVARDGGIICFNGAVNNGASVVLSGTFTDSSATSGGVISVMGSSLGSVVLSGTFKDNTATNGGVININNNIGTLTMTGTYDNNTATYGGVLNVPTSADNIVINGASFTKNSAEIGSALRLYNVVSVNVDDSDFIDNNATEWTIYSNSPVSIGDNVNFENNIGGLISPIVKPTSITLSLSSSTIHENREVRVDVGLNGLSTYNKNIVKIYINDEYYCDILVDNYGKGNVTFSNLRRDNYIISASYAGTKTYSSSSASASLKVIAATNTLTFNDLKNLINNTPAGEIVYLKGNYTFDSVEDADLIEGIVIDRDIVINGKGYTIDGNSFARVFNLGTSVKNFELTNITVQNAKADKGAVVYCMGALDKFVLNGTFINNHATSTGGVVYGYNSNFAKEFILDGNYYDNYADSYGGVLYMASGSGKLIGNFIGNHAIRGGVLDLPYGNTAAYVANGIVFSGYFENNYATGSGDFAGGAVGYGENNLPNTWTFNGTFIGNHATNGGVVLAPRNIKNIVLSGTFEDNYATNRGGVAAIDTTNAKYDLGNIIVTGDFTDNSAPNGAVVWTPTNPEASIASVIVENATFANNTATTGGALVLNNVKDGAIKNSTFTENKAKTGGAIILDTDNVDIENNTFTKNVATISGANIMGGGINSIANDNIYDGELILNGTSLTLTLSSNSIYADRDVLVTVTLSGLVDYTGVEVKLNITPGSQESIALDSSGTGSIRLGGFSSRVYNLVAYYEGNSQYLPSNSSQELFVLKVLNSYSFTDLKNLIDNTPAGEVVYLKGNYTFDSVEDADLIEGIVIDRDIVIDGNGYTIDGDSLARVFKVTHGGTFELSNVTVQNAKAVNGAVVYLSSGLVKLVLNGTFINNYATSNGGVVNGYANNVFAKEFILDGTYYKNHATNGGVVYAGAASGKLIGNFIENYAEAGAVYCHPYGTSSQYFANGIVFSGYFENNRATGSKGGGVAYAENDVPNPGWTFNGTFIGNRAQNGGVLSTYRNIKNVEFSGTFTNNAATGKGSVAVIDSSNAKYNLGNIIVTGEFINNVAGDSLIWTPSNSETTVNSIIIENATFENNSATNSNLLTLNNVKDLNITNSSFAGSGVKGSVIAIGGTTADANIHDVNVTNTKGTAITVSSQDTDISNVTIDNVVNGNGIVVNDDNTNIDNVTVKGVGENNIAIDVNGDNANITNSQLTGNAGIAVNVNGDGVSVTDNNITGNGVGVRSNGENSTIHANNVTGNAMGIEQNGDNSSIADNNFDDNTNDVVIDENSAMNTPQTKEDINRDNGGAKASINPNLVVSFANSTVINITLPDDATGYLNITIDKIYQADNVQGNVTFDVPAGILPGDYSVTISYSGDTNYSSMDYTFDLTIPRWIPTVQVNGDSIVYSEDANISVILPEGAEGSVSFDINNMIKQVTVVNNTANITVSELPAGENNITFIYSGDDKYDEFEGYAIVNVAKANSSVVIDSINNVTYGDDVTVKFNVTNATVINYVVSKNGIVVINSSIDSDRVLILHGLDAGDYIITIYNAEGDNYNASEAFATFNVAKRNTDLSS